MLSRGSIWRIAPTTFKLQGLLMGFGPAYESAIRILEHTIGRPKSLTAGSYHFRLKYSTPYIQEMGGLLDEQTFIKGAHIE